MLYLGFHLHWFRVSPWASLPLHLKLCIHDSWAGSWLLRCPYQHQRSPRARHERFLMWTQGECHCSWTKLVAACLEVVSQAVAGARGWAKDMREKEPKVTPIPSEAIRQDIRPLEQKRQSGGDSFYWSLCGNARPYMGSPCAPSVLTSPTFFLSLTWLQLLPPCSPSDTPCTHPTHSLHSCHSFCLDVLPPEPPSSLPHTLKVSVQMLAHQRALLWPH